MSNSELLACPFEIGQEVMVIPDCADWAVDWRDMPLWIAAIDAVPGGGFDFTVSDVWPLPPAPALTDGFWMGVKDKPNTLFAIDRTQLDELRARYDERLTDLQMLAFKWMDAHDKLKAGLPYELPKPADVPDTMAQLDELRAALEWYAEQAEGCRKLGHIGDPARRALDADGGKRARKALGGTNV